jgi:hypothetical protein
MPAQKTVSRNEVVVNSRTVRAILLRAGESQLSGHSEMISSFYRITGNQEIVTMPES